MANFFDQVDPPNTPAPALNGNGGDGEVWPISSEGNPQRPALTVTPHVASPKPGSNFFDQVDPPASPPQPAQPDILSTSEGKKLAADVRTKADQQLLQSAGGAGPVYTAAESAANTALLNVPRNIAAAARSAQTGEGFDHEYNFLKDVDAAAERQNPKSAIAGTLGGVGLQVAAMPEMAADTLFGKAAPTALVRGVQGAGIGGATSGLSELADTKDLGNAGTAALHGAGIGGALGTAGGKLESAFAPNHAGNSNRIAKAADRLGVQVPITAATDSMPVQRAAAVVKNIPYVGDPLVKGSQKAISGLSEANAEVAGKFGAGTGPNVAHNIGEHLRGLKDAEMTANRQAAETATAKARADALTADETAREVADTALAEHKASKLARVSDIEQRATQAAQKTFGDVTPPELGEKVTEKLRAGESAAKAKKEELYKEAGAKGQAFVDKGAVENIHNRVAGKLEELGRIIDPKTTPAAAQMLKRLADVSGLRLQNMASTAGQPARSAIVGVDVAALEHTRQVLNAMSQGAATDADRAASKIIVHEFTNAVDDAFDRGLFSGDQKALDAYREARAANRDWRQRFGYNAETDADKVLNKIATGEVTPNETANWIIGNTKIGASGSSSRLIGRIATATNNDPEVMQSIRGAIWNRLSGNAEGVAEKSPVKVANDIHEFLSGSGSSVAKQVFTDEQRKIAAIYADAMRFGQKAREEIEAGHKPIKIGDTKVPEIKPEVGPIETLAKRVIGSGMGRSDEALFDAIGGYAKSTSRGDLTTLSRLLNVIPQEDKGNLAGALIRRMGASPRGAGEFSGDVWLSNWRQTSPQAKTLLFGNAGTVRQSLDDIATISERFKSLNQFANPSGTGHHLSGAALLTGVIHSPIQTIATAVTGRIAAEALAKPATAATMASWAKAYDRAVRVPGKATATALVDASRALSNVIQKHFDKHVDPVKLLPVAPTYSNQ